MTELAIIGGALALLLVVLVRRRKRPGCPRCS